MVRRALALAAALAAPSVLAADLVLSNQTVTLGGVQTYGIVSLTNGSRILVPAYDGTANTGNLVLRADRIMVDATSAILAKGAGYQGVLCGNGAGPTSQPLAGGRGGCAVRDSAGGGAHAGDGGRGTKDCFIFDAANTCTFPQEWEEACGVLAGGACVAAVGCYDYDGLPTVAGQAFQHSVHAVEFGAAGGDKGCRDGDGFTPFTGTTVALAAGSGGGGIVLFAANAAKTGELTIDGVVGADGNRGCASGNDSGGGGAGGTVLLVGDSVLVGGAARVTANGGRGGDAQPKCLGCTTSADCASGQTCTAGRCGPCNCTPCTSSGQCNAALGQTCRSLGGALGSVCADASGQCTPVPTLYEESECRGRQNTGTADDCGGGGGGGVVALYSRVASLSPLATFQVEGALGGSTPICSGEAGGGAGSLVLDGAYAGEVCDGWDNDFNGVVDDGLPPLDCGGAIVPSCVNGLPQQCPPQVPACIGPVTDTRPRVLLLLDTSAQMLLDQAGNPTFGDGSLEHPGVDTGADADAIDGNGSRLAQLKVALNGVLAGFPQVDLAVARLHQDVGLHRSCRTAASFECARRCCSYDDPRDNVSPAFPVPPGCDLAALYPGAGYPASLSGNVNAEWADPGDCVNYAGTCGDPRRGADVLVGFGRPLEQALSWIDGRETSFVASTVPGDHCGFQSGGDCELRAGGPRPLAGALEAAADYLEPILSCDAAAGCRRYAVVLVATGGEGCAGDPVAAAAALGGRNIATYVIALSAPASDRAVLDAVAAAGGTGGAFSAGDAAGVENALASILAALPRYERCNDLDDDCDGQIDEDFPEKGAGCDDGGLGICRGTGFRTCSGSQDGTTCTITSPGQPPGTEVCNGLDDDCDGLVDEETSGASCLAGRCPGTTTCLLGGTDSCTPAPSPELCNGLDDDCDGEVDESPDVDVDPALGAACDPPAAALGACHTGVVACVDGLPACTGAVGPTGEACNGVDDDCDGTTDEEAPCDEGRRCASGACRLLCRTSGEPCPGGTRCVDGVCLEGSPPPGPGAEPSGCGCGTGGPGLGLLALLGLAAFVPRRRARAVPARAGVLLAPLLVAVALTGCSEDTSCPAGTLGDAANCGGCGHRCDLPGAWAACAGGTCAVSSCAPGLVDADGVAANGCELACDPATAGPELCNGLDDDCDGLVDEPEELADQKPAAEGCNLAPGSPCLGADFTCQGTAGWRCVYGPGVELDGDGALLLVEARCDGIDGNCDGEVDESFLDLGAACDDGALGSCRATGVRMCGDSQEGTVCQLTTPGRAPAAEACNGLDDDCNGLVDDGIADDMVQVTAGEVSFRVDRYEASRPDATALSPGLVEARRCVKPGVLPWTFASQDEAAAACAATGARLCTAGELQAACEGGVANAFPYGASYQPAACNGLDLDGVPGGADDDVLLPAGSAPLAGCVTADGIHDLSGNAAEWTSTLTGTTGPPAYTPILVTKGGSFLTPAVGLTCQFTLARYAATTREAEVGFRCCKDG
jgi:hypothetical protein